MDNLKPLIVILGPTASGKTGLALELAKKFNGELINADSRQIYKEMDIATNKIGEDIVIKKNVQNETVYFIDTIPIYLMDLIDPDQDFSLAEYKKIAVEEIKEVQEKGCLPILVGGTGLYISAIVDNLDIPQAAPDKNLRQELEKESVEDLFAQLQKVDPASAESIGPDNKRKIIRALEVYRTSGKPFSSLQKKGKPLFDVLQIGIKTDRDELYKKIDQRVEQMVKTGLIEETEKLLGKYDSNLPSMTGIGYREIGHFLRSEMELQDAVQQIKFHTHQYARRQITWFKRDNRINWVENYQEAEKLVSDYIK